jgi:RNA polymerase sigma-70 factor (ECF subfamily)
MATEETASGSPAFTTTHWSVVLASQGTEPARAAAALEDLCSRYWYPLYAFIRRGGRRPEDAKDLTQSFLAHILANDALHRVDRGKGLFRTFLLTSLTNFLKDDWDRQKAAKRGGGQHPVSWDELSAEERYARALVTLPTPEKVFDRTWADTLLEQALARLRAEYESKGHRELFAELKPHLTGEVPAGYYEEASATLATSAGSLKTAMSRLRSRLGELLRDEVANTVARPEDVKDEIRYLLTVLAG